MTITEAAKILKLSPRRVQELCREGRIAGARCVGGRVWVLPSELKITPGTRGPAGTYRQ